MRNISASKRIYLGVIAVTILVVVVIAITQRNDGGAEAEMFYRSSVSGVIEELSYSNGLCVLKLVGEDRRWRFLPSVPPNTGYRSFAWIAERGDTMTKHAFSDTIQLYSDGKMYEYLYRH